MPMYTHTVDQKVYAFDGLRDLLAKASPARILENPLFGRPNLRSDPRFGPFCQQVRQALSPGRAP